MIAMPWWKRRRSDVPEQPPATAAPPRPADRGRADVTLRLRATTLGQLPSDGTALIAGQELTGRRFVADPAFDQDGSGPAERGWLTDDEIVDVEDSWWRLAHDFHNTGLWPLVTDGLNGDLDRPWREGELGAIEDPEGVDVEAFLRSNVEEDEPDDDAEVRWQGLAPAMTLTADGAPAEANVGQLPYRLEAAPLGALMVVAAQRPADVLARLGWLGAVNLDAGGGQLSAVLRSWEDRFGAVPVCVGFDTLVLAVSRPPTDPAALEQLALEHYGFCPDNIEQGSGSVEAYTMDLAGQRMWSFWWD
jgi:hypothetical protein